MGGRDRSSSRLKPDCLIIDRRTPLLDVFGMIRNGDTLGVVRVPHNVMTSRGVVYIITSLLQDRYDLLWLEGWHSGHMLMTSAFSILSSRLGGTGSPCFCREVIYP